jgi:hypothetical protein
MVNRGHAYIGHLFSGGFSVIDVRDPRAPVPANFIPSVGATWNHHLQVADDLLFVVDMYDLFGDARFQDEKKYYGATVYDVLGKEGSASCGIRGEDYSAGMRIFDISEPAKPRQVGQFEIDGLGIHRIWYVGGKYAYVSALPDGYTDCIFMILDVSDPAHPFEVSRWWLPGMHAAGGEEPTWRTGDRVACHHGIVANEIAYVTWRDGGLTIMDVSDAAKPKLLVHRNWHPPFGGGTHTAVPLTARVPNPKEYLLVADEAVADECADGMKHTWVMDIRDKSNPVSVAVLPTPSERDWCRVGGHFGPHNLHENRPGSFQSSDVCFATYENAGVRAFDIRDPLRPAEVASFVPSSDLKVWVDPRPGRPKVVHSCDVYADPAGLLYVTDLNGGLHIVQYEGPVG